MRTNQSVLRAPGRWAHWCVVGAIALAGIFSWSAAVPAVAQNASMYQALPIDQQLAADEKAVKNLALVKGRILMGSVPLDEQGAQQFDRWYKGYFFPSFTKPDELSTLTDKREELKKDLRVVKSAAVHDRLLTVTFAYMKGIVQSPKYNFHPAVRFNAMLMIGDLNQTEASVQQRFPDPYPPALDVMVQEFNNPNQTDAVRVAAMLGMLRHAKLDWTRQSNQRIPAATRTAIVNDMLALLKSKDPPGSRTPEGHAWMQRLASEVVGALGAVGPMDEVNQVLATMVEDQEAPLPLRGSAARAWKFVMPPSQPKPSLDASQLSLKLAGLAVDACRKELERLEEEQEKAKLPTATGGGGYYGGYMGGMMEGMMSGMMSGGYEEEMESEMGGYGGEEMYGEEGMEMEMGGYGGEYGGYGYGGGTTAKPKDPLMDPFRRRIKTHLVAVQAGLAGAAKLAGGGPQQPQVADVTQKINDLLAATDPVVEETPAAMTRLRPKTPMEKLTDAINEALRPLEQMLRRSSTQTEAAQDTTIPDVPDTPAVGDTPVAPDTPVSDIPDVPNG